MSKGRAAANTDWGTASPNAKVGEATSNIQHERVPTFRAGSSHLWKTIAPTYGVYGLPRAQGEWDRLANLTYSRLSEIAKRCF